MRVRSFTLDDYDAVAALWAVTPHVAPVPRADVEAKLSRDPELFLVAEDGDGPVGVVMGGFDGRRGWIARLAVAPARRGSGIGRTLVREVERRLEALGATKVNLLVLRDNAAGQAFWERCGYEVFDGIVLASRRLDGPTEGPAC